MFIDQSNKYYTAIFEYFKDITKDEMLKILNEPTYRKHANYQDLIRAAVFSDHLDSKEIFYWLEKVGLNERICESIIKNKRMTGSEIISLLQKRSECLGGHSSEALAASAIEAGNLTGPEIMELLETLDIKREHYVSMAKPQLEKYIESEEA
jgi:hypothetical protein